MTNRLIAAALGALAALTLTGCGQTTQAAAPTTSATGTGAAAAGCADVKTSSGPVDLTDAFGRTVRLPEPAQRVAVLEWQQTEDLLSLCVDPVAVADVKGFGTWVTAEKLPAGTTDVGTRPEPNLEALFATDPDLVVVEAYTQNDEILSQLAKFGVPVLATKGADTADPIANMKSTFGLIAEATGRQERAEAVIAEFDATIAAATKTVAASDAAGEEFVFFDAYLDGANVTVRPFGQGSLVGEIGEVLGLKNAWTGKVDPAYGLGQTDIEGMTTLGAATFLHTGTIDPDGDVTAKLNASPVWRAIPAVAEKRTRAFPAGIWTFGGPRSSADIVEAYVDAVAK